MPTTDLAASVRFYRDGLGLELAEEWVDLGRGAILRGSIASEIERIEAEEATDPPEPRTALGLQVSEDEWTRSIADSRAQERGSRRRRA